MSRATDMLRAARESVVSPVMDAAKQVAARAINGPAPTEADQAASRAMRQGFGEMGVRLNDTEQNPVSVTAVLLNTKDAIVDGLRAASNSHHAAPLHAWIRQGADEAAQLLSAFPDGIKPVAENGQMFEPTPHLVTEQITGKKMYSAGKRPEMDMG